MLKSLSISGMMEKSKKREAERNSRIFTKAKTSEAPEYGLTDEIIMQLIDMGFLSNQILAAYLYFKFKSVEEALKIFLKDPDTGVYNHKFTSSESAICEICLENEQMHIDDINKLMNRDEELPITSKQKRQRVTSFRNVNRIKEAKYEGTSKNLIDLNEEDTLTKEINYCPVCMEGINSEDFFALDCGHLICRGCITNFIRIHIRDKTSITYFCLFGNCKNEYTSEMIAEFICNEDWIKYKALVRKKEIWKIHLENNKNLVNCPYPDCEELVQINNFNLGISTYDVCASNHRFCTKCRCLLSNHSSLNCSNFVKLMLEEIPESKRWMFKQCPRCNIIIEKNEGCNHMTCTVCQYEFCWICLEKYEPSHYALYNFTGCPGLLNGKQNNLN